MNKLNLLSKLVIAGFAGVSALAVSMKAEAVNLKIDSFSDLPTGIAYEARDIVAEDNIPNNDGVFNFDIPSGDGSGFPPNPGTGIPGVHIPGVERLFIYGELFEGDAVTARLCGTCKAGELASDVGGSLGRAIFGYAVSETLNISEFDQWEIAYSSDQDDLVLSLYDDNGTPTDFLDDILIAESDPLPSTGFAGPPFLETVFIDFVDPDATIDLGFNIRMTATNPNTDASIDIIKAPEPGTILGLLAVSGLGFGLKRKKQS